jgi:hypothetical protein
MPKWIKTTLLITILCALPGCSRDPHKAKQEYLESGLRYARKPARVPASIARQYGPYGAFYPPWPVTTYNRRDAPPIGDPAPAVACARSLDGHAQAGAVSFCCCRNLLGNNFLVPIGRLG